MFIRPKGEPRRFRRHRYGPGGFRLITAALATVVGLAVAILGAIDVASGRDDPVVLLCGLGVFVIGIAGFVVARWMARRGV